MGHHLAVHPGPADIGNVRGLAHRGRPRHCPRPRLHRHVCHPGATLAIQDDGNLVIYAIGVPYLAANTGMDLATAIDKGATPFLLGDAVKIVLAAGLLPTAWALVRRVRDN